MATAVSTSADCPEIATAVPARPTAVPLINTPRPAETPVSILLLPSDGLLEVRIIDVLPPVFTKIIVTTSLIEVHKGDAVDDTGWISVFDGDERTFDLVVATTIEDVLGTETFAAGKYTQIRMYIVSVTVTRGGLDI